MRVRREIVLPTTTEQAWALLVEWERQADWMRDADRVDVVSPRREGVGVRLAVATRIAGRPAFTEPVEVTAWDPPRRLEIRHGRPVAGSGTWDLAPIAGGTRFVWTEDVRLAVPFVGGVVAWCYRPILRVLMGRAMDDLRRYAIAIGPVRDG
jgi:hypothetical protein